MTATCQQIVTAYEELDLSPSEIAESDEFGEFDEIAIKAVLMQYSVKYRKDAKKDVSLQYNNTEQEEAKQAIIGIMRHAEDPNLILRAAKYIRDDAMGRLDIGKQMNTLNVSVQVFNEQMEKAKRAELRTLNVLKDEKLEKPILELVESNQ